MPDEPAARTAPATGVARLDPRSWSRQGVVLFASSADAPRTRRPTDVLLLLGSLLVLALIGIPAPGPTPLDTAVQSVATSLPGTFGWFWEAAYALLLVWVAVLLVLAALRARTRQLLRDQALALAIAVLVALVVALLAGVSVSDLWSALSPFRPGSTYPALRIAVATAVLVTSAPHLSRPIRRVGRWILVFGAIASVALQIDLLTGLVAGLAAGVLAASAVHVALGSPGGRVPLELVADELLELGVEVHDLAHAPFEPRGVAVATARDTTGRPLLVRIYGRDAWEGSFFASVWSWLLYRDGTPTTQVGRQRQVEHEAFLTLMAERAGVPVQPIVTAGTAWGRDAFLVRRDDGRRLPEVADEEISPQLLQGFWEALKALHGAGIAHGALDPGSLVVRPDGSAALADLGSGTSAPDDASFAVDHAQLLVSTAARAGIPAAVAAARVAGGDARLVATLPYLQPAALDSETRRAAKAADWKMDALRQAVVDETGTPAPELEKLRRVSVGSVVMVVLLGVVAYTVISAVAGIGLDTLVAQFQGAAWGWILLALLLSPTIQVGQAIATLGASVAKVRFIPVLGLQYAVQFLGLAVPSSAAKVGLEVRFFQLVGSNATTAVAVGLIDSVGGLVVQILVIVVTLLTGLVALTPSTTESSSSGSGSGSLSTTLASVDWTAVLVIVLVLAVVAGVILAAVPRIRHSISAFVRERSADSRVALRVLRSPRKLGLILAGSVMWNVIAAMVLSCSVNAFGQHATFAELILVNTLVSLFAGLMPIPGNIGVSEAALTAGLMAVGIPQAAALSAAIVYRMVTFYLPPIWGYAAMRVMRRRGYL